MDEDPSPSRRASGRRKTYKEAKVVLHDRSTIDCILRNLSDGGARLEFSDAIALPETFDLLIVSTQMLVPARRIWERAAHVGIQFTGPERSTHLRKF